MFRVLVLFASIMFFLPLITGCAGVDRRDSSLITEPVVAENVAVKSYSSGAFYKNKQSTVLKKPAEFQTCKAESATFEDENIKILLYAKKFAQGNAAYAEVIYKKDSGLELKKLSFNEQDIPFSETPWGWRSIFAISPLEKSGTALFKAVYNSAGAEQVFESRLNVRKVDFPVSKYLIDLGKFSDKTYTLKPEIKEFVKECEEIRSKAFSSVSEDCLSNELCHPRDMHKITGDYWKKRTYADYKKKGKKKVKVAGHKSFHRGVDLKGNVGAPVYAMAEGRVVLSHKMFYEGNMVVLDHGNQVFTYYMHMDKLEVKEGESVKAGTLIGRVGSTGTSTGPHLHVALSIRGVHVDPMSLLALPIGK